MTGSRSPIVIEPSRSVLVIIDMQSESMVTFASWLGLANREPTEDYFLDPALAPKATAGRGVVNATVNMIHGFRKAGMKILWTNWGLTDFDILTMPPALLSGFSKNGSDLESRQSNVWPQSLFLIQLTLTKRASAVIWALSTAFRLDAS